MALSLPRNSYCICLIWHGSFWCSFWRNFWAACRHRFIDSGEWTPFPAVTAQLDDVPTGGCQHHGEFDGSAGPVFAVA